MNKVLDFLDGKKTYIGGAIVFIAGGLKAIGKIDENTFQILVTLGGSIVAIGLRLALRKLE